MYESYFGALTRVVEWRRNDRPWTWIATELNILRVPSKRGLKWTNQTARKTYLPLIEKRMAAKKEQTVVDQDREPPVRLEDVEGAGTEDAAAAVEGDRTTGPERGQLVRRAPVVEVLGPEEDEIQGELMEDEDADSDDGDYDPNTPLTIDRLSPPPDESIPADIDTPEGFREYLLATQTERARSLIEDLMLAPPRLAEVLDEATINSLTVPARAFLTALIFTFGNATLAARAAGVNAQFHRNRMSHSGRADLAYQAAYPAVYTAAVDHLEAVVMYRAVWGEKQYRFDRAGKPLQHPETGRPYYEYVKSDLLLERFMRARRPETWRPNVEVEIDLNSVGVQFTDEQLRRIAAGESPRKVLTSG